MKLVIILFFTISFNHSWGQLSPSQRWEKAQFEVVRKGKSAFRTVVRFESILTKNDFLQLEKAILEKEGIIDVKSKSNAIEVSYMDLIDLGTIKQLITPFRQDISFEEKTEIIFD